jgi:DNA (cytosine-5)-methyltransferase 1
MKIGTDFSGIGAPEMALKYLGIDFESVFACEIDKYARQSFQQLHNPKTFYNDITNRNHKEVKQLDLYVAGFPCQAFSTAGKRKGFEEARGTLFFNVAEFIQINQPKVFVLENVKGLLSHDRGNTFQTIVDILSNGGGTQNGQISLDVFEDGLGYHIYWQVLNTKDYGIPQNRERIFIVGFKNFREFSFPKPMELKLRLGDMLQDNLNSKYYLSDKTINRISNSRNKTKFKNQDSEYSGCLIAGYNKIPSDGTYIEVKDKYYLSDKLIQSFNNHKERHTKKGTGFKWEVKKKDDVVNCLRANASLCPTDNTIEVSKEVRTDEAKKKRKETGTNDFRDKKIEWRRQDYSNTITTSLTNDHYIKQKKIRRLTPLECWRLQGFRDEDFFSVKDVSDTQLYKQAGNSITVNVLMELFKKIYVNDNK